MNELTDMVQPTVDSGSSTGSNRPRRRSANEWREWIERQAASGLSIAAFCREHGLAASGFHQWRRRLRSAEAPTGDSSAGFVRLEPAGDGQPVTVRIGDRVTLHCSAEHLEQLVPLLLREAQAC